MHEIKVKTHINSKHIIYINISFFMKKKDGDGEKKHYIRPQTCRNCGINGHLYKDCVRPIMSFGVICYKIENGIVKYLMIQRKDSLSFMEFIRGKYNTNDIRYIRKLLSGMTNNERQLLRTKTFDEIWVYAWYQNNTMHIKQTVEYVDSKQKFDTLCVTHILKRLLEDRFMLNVEQEWGFPKGRRKLKERDFDCAVREFCEETRLKSDDIEVLDQQVPFEEIFFGTNDILYKHTYYLAKMKNMEKYVSIDHNCVEQMREVRALKWFTYEETINHIKKRNIERQKIIENVHSIILSNEKIR
jgi:8-oxo-dGTP pyrophosphatase MutT (NUDIX family)